MYNQKLKKDDTVNRNLNSESYQNTPFNMAIENVLHWSTAKSVHTLEVPNLERNNMRSSESKYIYYFFNA